MRAVIPPVRRSAVALALGLVPLLALLGQSHPSQSRELDALAGALGAAGVLLRFVPDLACAVTAAPRAGAPASSRSGLGAAAPRDLYVSFMRGHRNTLRPFMSIRTTSAAASTWSIMMDFVFIAGGVGIFGLFALYTVLLRRI